MRARALLLAPVAAALAGSASLTSVEDDFGALRSLKDQYGCFGAAARSLPVGDETLDRLTVLGHAPGYMLHYALGAVVAADVRARCREQRGTFAKADPSYYDWFAARLFRFGPEHPTRQVLADLARLQTPAGR